MAARSEPDKMKESALDVSRIGEFELIARLTRGLPPGKGVVLGVGDDAAALEIAPDRLLLATCDIQVEGVHFVIGAISPAQIGRRAAAVNLSDIAAMGGVPTFALASLAVPRTAPVELLDGVYEGLVAALREAGAELVGGNTSHLPERMALDVFLLGEVERASLLTRCGARDGDAICVTGSLGGSAAGLRLVLDSGLACDARMREEALERHFAPVPRLREGRFLGLSGLATACIDVSDGLIGDVEHLAEASGLAAFIDADAVPIAPCARAVGAATGGDPLSLALKGGEDYELAFTAPRARASELAAAVARETGTPVAIVGEMRAGEAKVHVTQDGREIALRGGFTHF
ncbi:MAG: thiamine-phosphate kinase [Deltaproteobacteria bacterium]|nr:thiamine-phosphate kinase [Deltaproteobacteria bacterium]